MKAKSVDKSRNKNIAHIALGTLGLLLIPLIFTLLGSGVDGDGLHWTVMDFIVMGLLLFVTGLAINEVIIRVREKNKRLVIASLVILAFLYIWAELAVGIFTNLGS